MSFFLQIKQIYQRAFTKSINMSNTPSKNSTKYLTTLSKIFLIVENSTDASNASEKVKPSDDGAVG